MTPTPEHAEIVIVKCYVLAYTLSELQKVLSQKIQVMTHGWRVIFLDTFYMYHMTEH